MRSTQVTKIRKDYIASREVYDKAMRKRKKNLIKRLSVLALFVIFSVGGLMSILHNQSGKIEQVEKKKNELKQQYQTVQNKQEDLSKQIKLLHDPDYLGKIARRDYYMSKDGEIIFASPEEDKH